MSCNTDPSWTICNKLSIPQYPEGQKSQQINTSLFIVFSVAHQKYRRELTLFLFYGKSVILFYFFQQETASLRRAALTSEPTLITFISSTISRLCLNCRTGWSPELRTVSPSALFTLSQCQVAKGQSADVSFISQDTSERRLHDRSQPQGGAIQ